jgi:hypothetical protein
LFWNDSGAIAEALLLVQHPDGVHPVKRATNSRSCRSDVHVPPFRTIMLPFVSCINLGEGVL